MKRWRWLVCAAAMTANACQNMPQPYAPPVQRQPLEDFRPYRIATVVNMSDPETRFVQDITSIQAEAWRWTGKRPTVRVHIHSAEKLRYTIDFAIAETTFKVTGPVTVSFLVNDRVLDRIRYSHPGEQHFEKPVPAGWVAAEQDVNVGAEIDKLWKSPNGRDQLGMILVRMGLTE